MSWDPEEKNIVATRDRIEFCLKLIDNDGFSVGTLKGSQCSLLTQQIPIRSPDNLLSLIQQAKFKIAKIYVWKTVAISPVER